MRYSIQFKQATVNRFYSSGLGKITFARKYKIDRGTLISWLKQFSQTENIEAKDNFVEVKEQKRVIWSNDKKLWAVFTYSSLDPLKRGEFLRSNGLYSHQVHQWKHEMTNGLVVGFKNLEELKTLAKKIKEQDAIIQLQKKTSQYFQEKVKS
jgi:transposase-like protein